MYLYAAIELNMLLIVDIELLDLDKAEAVRLSAAMPQLPTCCHVPGSSYSQTEPAPRICAMASTCRDGPL